MSDVLVQGGYSALFGNVTIRRATLSLEVELPERADDALGPLLGYCCGFVCGTETALICGLEASATGPDELKAVGAAFAPIAASRMFHIAGITPEADDQRPER
jgi:predicted aconitase